MSMTIESNKKYLKVRGAGGIVPARALGFAAPSHTDNYTLEFPREGVWFKTKQDCVVPGGWGQGWRANDVPVKAGQEICLIRRGTPLTPSLWGIRE